MVGRTVACTLAACLLVVIVAWTCAWSHNPWLSAGGTATPLSGTVRWLYTPPARWPGAPIGGLHIEAAQWEIDSVHWVDDNANVFGQSRMRFGWPRPALERVEVWELKAGVRKDLIGTVWVGEPLAVGHTRYPLRPVWRNFVLNAAAYAAILVAAVETLLFAVRRWRRERGGCLKCGYSREGLAENAECPECGARPVNA